VPPANGRRVTRRGRPPRALREAGISARRSLGQHFLTSQPTLAQISAALELRPNEAVIEIGAGLGALTEHLVDAGAEVVAIELDERLANYLEQRFAAARLTVVRGDAATIDPADVLLAGGVRPPYAVTGNLPYNVAQPILRRYLEAQPPPRRMVLMVQREVAKSIVAKPPQMSLLGVSVQLYGDPAILFHVPASVFYPPPRVQSSVIRIDITPRPRVDTRAIEVFFQVVRAGFSTKRKQLRNALANGLDTSAERVSNVLVAAGIDPSRRAQELSLDDWATLARAWAKVTQSGDVP
jgi:16S rRNA (adenine1518-N6/adenine1519-N6)-dimethyltransferase